MWCKPIVPVRIGELPPVWVDLPSANDQVVDLLKYREPYEPHLQTLFRRYIRPTDTVVDVGANVGLHSVLFDTLAARVLAFEPHPRIQHALRRTISGLPRTRLIACALADFEGTAPFNVEGDHTAGALSALGELVQVRRLDDVLMGDPVHFMKVDVEGHEVGVFRGAERTLRAHRPVIVYEQLRRAGSDAHDFLEPLGYRFALITRSGRVLPWSTQHEWCDVLAVPSGQALPPTDDRIRPDELAGVE